jgi:subtilase-type serine protease
VRQALPNSAWMESLALDAVQRAAGGSPGYNPRVLGTVSGYDRMLRDGLLLGASAGYSKTDVDVKDSADRNSIGSSFASLYGSLFTDRGYADAALTYGRHRFSNLRVVEIGATSFNAESGHDGDALSAYVESGLNLFLGGVLLEPFASGRFGMLFEDDYEESGMAGANLRVDARTTKSLVSQLGTRVALPFRLGSWTFIPEVMVAWDHDFDLGDPRMEVAFESAPTMKFTTDGPEAERDGLSAGFGLTIISKNHVSISADYKGQFREGYVSHSLVGGIRFEF